MNTDGLVDPSGRARSTRIVPSTSVSSPSRTMFASGSRVSASSTCWVVTSTPLRSLSRSAMARAVSSLMDGNSLLMPAAAVPVMLAQVAKTMRSDASRGATPTPCLEARVPAAASSAGLLSTPAPAAGASSPPAFSATRFSTSVTTSATEASRSA